MGKTRPSNPFDRAARGATRRYRVPIWLRLLPVGLALIVGAFVYALVRTYVAFAQGWQGAIADGADEPAPFEHGFVRWAMDQVVVSASPAGAIFWIGVGVLGLAVVSAAVSIATRAGR